ncbi:hypothetical protein G6653_09420 [Polynucleobacter paneuropaeus]|jgi:hypothetical protein|nr:hypothetical protein [Polynucleobacter paneuropaeus]MBT8611583.1 hypothetical protein [Polynucleobacter paneuropaeus]
MTERYFGKVVNVLDDSTVVINRGSENDVILGDKLLVVGLGPMVIDPDTKEEFERLEIVRGRVLISHVQQKISTACTYEIQKSSDVKEIKKVTSRGGGIVQILGPQDTITESIQPGKETVKSLNGVEVGDLLIKL